MERPLGRIDQLHELAIHDLELPGGSAVAHDGGACRVRGLGLQVLVEVGRLDGADPVVPALQRCAGAGAACGRASWGRGRGCGAAGRLHVGGRRLGGGRGACFRGRCEGSWGGGAGLALRVVGVEDNASRAGDTGVAPLQPVPLHCPYSDCWATAAGSREG